MNLLNTLSHTVTQVPAMPGWVVLLSKATLLLTVAWLIHFAMAKVNPRWRVLLWRGVAVGLLLLVVWTVGLPGYAVHVEAPEPITVSRPPVVAVTPPEVLMEAPVPWVEPVEMPVFQEATTMAPVEPIAVDVPTEAAPTIKAARTPLPWLTILVIVWAVGVVLLVARTVVAYVRLVSLLRNSQAAPDAVLAEVERIAAALGCRSVVRVRRSERFAVPFLYGLRRPTLVLPQRMCETSYGSQLPAILAHELAHMCSRDLAWNTVVQAVSIGLWFHPLAWRIGLAHQAACDRVADAVSAAYLGDVQAYCQTLASVALEAGSSVAPSVGLAMARHSDIRRRLALLQRRVFAAPLKRRLVAGVGLVGLMVLGLLAGVRFVVAEAALTNDEQQQPVAEQSGVRPMRIHVVDPDGNPIAGAGITVRSELPTRFVSADAEGVAEIEVPSAGTLRLGVTVWHDEYVTAWLRWPNGTPRESIPVDHTVTLARGTVLGGIVRNQQGEPLAGAEVTVRGSKSSPDAVLGWSINDVVESDADGKWSSRRIPEDLTGFNTEISVHHRNYVGHAVFEVAKLSIDELRARTAVMVANLEIDGWIIAGRVVDRETKAPVTKFRVMQGDEYGSRVHWRSSRLVDNKDGRYRVFWGGGGYQGPRDTLGDSPLVLRIEAEGHLPSDTRRLKPDKRSVTFDVELDRGEDIAGVVLSPDGKPLADAQVAFSTAPQEMFLRYGKPLQELPPWTVLTGANGRFSFTPRRESYSLAVTHDQGFAEVENEEGVKTITIQPWARVEGTLRIDSKPAAGQMVTLHSLARYGLTAARFYRHQATTDQQGRFTFEHIFPGTGLIVRDASSTQGRSNGRVPTHSVSVTLVAGETTQVELSREGRPVIGKVLLPHEGEYAPPGKEPKLSLHVVLPTSEIPIRPEIPWPPFVDPEKDPDQARAWLETWINTEEGKLYQAKEAHYHGIVQNATVRAEVARDGTFLFEDMPAGDYRLEVRFHGFVPSTETMVIDADEREFTIPEMPGGRSGEPLDLGDLTLSLSED